MQEGKEIEINLNRRRKKEDSLTTSALVKTWEHTHKIFTYTSRNTLQNENEKNNKREKNISQRERGEAKRAR